MMDRQALLNNLRKQPESQIVLQLRSLLERVDVRLVTGRGQGLTVSDALALWSTRVASLDLTGVYYDGGDHLLTALAELPPDQTLEQVALVAPGVASNLFFERSQPHRFVGAVIFKPQVRDSVYDREETGEAIAS